MEKNKIAFVVQRYGLEVNGGAEYHCRVLAEHMLKIYDADVLTSCAISYSPWDNYYDVGESNINGVIVRRFPVEKIRDSMYTAELEFKMRQGDESVNDDWIAEMGPFCPKLIEYLKNNAYLYKVIIFIGYAFYPSVMGLHLGLKNTILLPTAHDEPNIYMNIYNRTFKEAKSILYNSVEERKFLNDKFHMENLPSRLTCVGIDIPDVSELDMLEAYKHYDNYVVYVGRLSDGKNIKQLIRYFIQYKKFHESDLKLLVVGRADNEIKLIYYEDIIYLGYVSETDKLRFMKNARFLIMPSIYESLSLVILESMALGKPVLVNGDCEVMKGQCIRSNAGLYYTSYAEFEKAMSYMLTNKEVYNQMVQNGLEFVKNNYSWDYVVQNVSSLIEEMGE